MAIPTSGALAFSALQTEFGGTNPIGLSEYYAGGGLVPATASGTNGAVPSSGTIAMSKFYGTENVVFMAATGGSVSTSGDYKFHTFTGNGTFAVTTAGNQGFNYIVVAGGAGGSSSGDWQTGNGGGGAGGMLVTTNNSPTTGSFGVTIGGGGSAGTYSPSTKLGGNGSNSTFAAGSLTSTGGVSAYGGNPGQWSAGSGGSGIVKIRYKYQ